MMEATQAEDLDKLYQEDQQGVGSLIKTIWLTDKGRQKSFPLIRTRIVSAYFMFCFVIMSTLASGGHGNRWSMINIRMGE